jgi:2-dehydro-3-deoxygluconokinase
LNEIVTFGESMAVFTPLSKEPLRYVKDFRMRLGGAESNFAIGICKLGHSAGWFGRLSNDEFGRFILNSIRAEGVDTSRVIFDDTYRSGIMFKELNLDDDTKIYYYRENSAASHMCPDDLDKDYIAGAQLLHLTGITPVLSESCHETVLEAVKIAKSSNRLVSFDPNIRHKLWNDINYLNTITEILCQADIVSCGLDEAELLFKTRDINRVFETIFGKGARFAAVKNGADGAWVGTKDKICEVAPTRWKRVDSVGAGDAFDAGFIAGILEGLPIETCGKMGNIMGGLATQTTGDTEALPTREEMYGYLNNTQTFLR